MPYNFELTFTQPLLAQLDNGSLKGAKDWANAITKAYITTIKSGLPIGVPPVLPAPGLNPTAPPPFMIGASSFSTADARSRRMYRVLYAYFYAKELKMDKAAIRSLQSSIAALIKKAKNGAKQIKRIVEQIKLVNEELKQLPILLQQIIQDIKQEVKDQINDIKDAFKILDSVKTTLPAGEFERLFADEIQLLEKIKNFNVTDLSGIKDLILFFSNYNVRSDAFLSRFDSTSSIKQYLISRLTGTFKILTQLAEGVVDPTKIINVVRDLASKKDRVKLLLAKLDQFDLYVRFLKPKLVKLAKRKKEQIIKVRKKLQDKIVSLTKKLQDKIKAFVNKRNEGKRDNLYVKGGKNKIDKKKKNAARIKEVRNKIKKLQKIYKLSVEVVGKTVALTKSADMCFENLKKEVKDYTKKLEKSRQAINELINKPNQLNVVTFTVPQITIPTPQINLDFIEQNKIEQEVKGLANYFKTIGLPQYSEIATKTLVDVKCDAQTFIRFFEKTTNYVKMFVLELVSLVETVEQLANEIRNFNENKGVGSKKLGFWAKRIKSVKDLLLYITTKLSPKVQAYPNQVKKLIKKQKIKLDGIKEKFKQELKTFAINMIPIKSDIRDKKDKQVELQAKEKKIKTKIKQIRRILRLSTYAAKMVRGGLAVYKNTEGGDYTLATNQISITQMIDGYYLLRSDSQPTSIQASLQLEKAKVLNTFKGILVVDMFGRALMDMFKSKQKFQIAQDLEDIIKTTKDNPPGVQTLGLLRDLFLNPPTTINDLKSALNNLTLSALQESLVINKIIQIEKKYLNKSKQVLMTLLDIKKLQGTGYEKKLKSVLLKLQKQDSFIVLLVDFVKDAILNIKRLVKLKIQKIATQMKAFLKKRKAEKERQAKKDLLVVKNKKANSDAIIMSSVFGLAARLFWVGAGWVGPTGSQHRVFTIGSFRPRIKARPDEGASSMIRQIARAFELQLVGARGIVTPIVATGIPPLPFNGYK